jgi:hypothetical protein
MQYDRRFRTRVAESSRIRFSDFGVSTMNTPISVITGTLTGFTRSNPAQGGNRE